MDSTRGFVLGAATVFFGYFAGILSVLFGSSPDPDLTARYLASQSDPRWWEGFCSGPLFVLLTVLCGVFFFGWLCVLPLIFYKSYGLGYTAGLFFAAFGTKGFLPLALCLFPSAVAVCVLMIRAGQAALPLSFSLFRGMFSDPAPFFSQLRAYLLRSLVLVQCSSLLLLWDLYLSPVILSGIRDLL